MPVRRRQTGPMPAIQQAFHAACLQAGFGTTNDKNGLHPAGLGMTPSNNIDGVQGEHRDGASQSGAPLSEPDGARRGVCSQDPDRGRPGHRRRSRKRREGIPDRSRPGGAERRGDPVAAAADALGHRPRGPSAAIRDTGGPSSPRCRPEPDEPPQRPDDLQGQRRRLARDHGPDAAHFALHYTAEGSIAVNDMVLRSSPVVDEREERVRGVRTKYLVGDVPPEQAARISCTLGLPDGSGYVKLASADPRSSRRSTIVICSIRTTFDGCATVCGWRQNCWNRTRSRTSPITGFTPTEHSGQ